jgi:hypothetical protein
VFFELNFEELKQGKSIGGAASEASQHLLFVQAADFAGVALHHSVAHGDLTVAADNDLIIPANREYCGAAKLFHAGLLIIDREKRV